MEVAALHEPGPSAVGVLRERRPAKVGVLRERGTAEVRGPHERGIVKYTFRREFSPAVARTGKDKLSKVCNAVSADFQGDLKLLLECRVALFGIGGMHQACRSRIAVRPVMNRTAAALAIIHLYRTALER